MREGVCVRERGRDCGGCAMAEGGAHARMGLSPPTEKEEMSSHEHTHARTARRSQERPTFHSVTNPCFLFAVVVFLFSCLPVFPNMADDEAGDKPGQCERARSLSECVSVSVSVSVSECECECVCECECECASEVGECARDSLSRHTHLQRSRSRRRR